MVEAGEMLEDVPSVARSDAVFAGHGVSIKAQFKEGSATKDVNTEKLESKKEKQKPLKHRDMGPTVHG